MERDILYHSIVLGLMFIIYILSYRLYRAAGISAEDSYQACKYLLFYMILFKIIIEGLDTYINL